MTLWTEVIAVYQSTLPTMDLTYDTPFWNMPKQGARDLYKGMDPTPDYQWNHILDCNPQFRRQMFENFHQQTASSIYREVHVSLIMTKFLLPFAIKIIDAAVDKIPEDLEDKLKEFVIGLLKKARLNQVTK